VAISSPQERSVPQRDCRAAHATTAPAKLGTRQLQNRLTPLGVML